MDHGYDPVYGARPLKRFVQRKVETQVGRMIIAGSVAPGATLEITCSGDDLVILPKE